MSYRTRIHFEGAIEVDIAANPNDAGLWADALADAWAVVEPDAVSDAASTRGHEIVGYENTETCDECGKKTAYIIGCPDGVEICQACFDAGLH